MTLLAVHQDQHLHYFGGLRSDANIILQSIISEISATVWIWSFPQAFCFYFKAAVTFFFFFFLIVSFQKFVSSKDKCDFETFCIHIKHWWQFQYHLF